jgi:hypothetical protein
MLGRWTLSYYIVSFYLLFGVNDTVGHTTCPVCALKSHILQTRLTGHITCETRAPKVTNRSVIRFFVKPIMRGQLDFFLHLTHWLKIMWYSFILLIFCQRLTAKKKSPNQDFFYRRELEFSVTMKS